MSADPTHSHNEMHRGQVPTDQLADGTASNMFIPVSNGDGTVTWGTGNNPHLHTLDVFVGDGATIDFVLSEVPLSYLLVAVSGLITWGSWSLQGDQTVEFGVAPANGDQILVYYEYAV